MSEASFKTFPSGMFTINRETLEEATRDFEAIMGKPVDQWFADKLEEMIDMNHLSTPPLKSDWPREAVMQEPVEFEADWRRRMQAVQTVVDTHQAVRITIEPIGKIEKHDDGAMTWKRGKIKVEPL